MDELDLEEVLTEAIPIINDLSVRVDCPTGCFFRNSHTPFRDTVLWLVIHLNDRHRWSREDIADWLETLDMDLSFPVPEDT